MRSFLSSRKKIIRTDTKTSSLKNTYTEQTYTLLFSVLVPRWRRWPVYEISRRRRRSAVVKIQAMELLHQLRTPFLEEIKTSC